MFLDKINELVHCSHLLRGDPNLLPDEMKIKLRGLCGKQWERFGYYGILTEELLKHEVFSSYYVYDDELFTPANLLELLQALLIISPINRTEFIMPCLLPDLDAEELDKHRSEVASSIAPLLVHFPNEWPQSGIFCSLVASLLSYSEWEVLQGGNNEPLLPKEGFHGQKRDNTKMNDNSCDKYTSLLLTIRFFHTVCSIILNCGNFSSFQKFLWHLQIITVGIAVQFTRHKGT